jgi:hypothetical protein
MVFVPLFEIDGRKTMSRRLLRAAVLATACLAPACFTSWAQAQSLRSFKAVLTFSESVSFPRALPCYGTGLLQGVGQATAGLGSVTAMSQDCINPLGLPDPNVPPAFGFVSGTGPQGLVFTTSTGEQVQAVYAGTLTPQAGRPYAVNGFFVVTGGTGRYARASGGGTLQGSETLNPDGTGQGEISLSGRIAY